MIPISLVELQQLKYLNLSLNDFTDNHIPEFFGSMSNLRHLDRSYYHFVGKIPSQFRSFSHLKYSNLRENDLKGSSIPYQLGNLSKLQYLDLGQNSLQGAIPSQLGNFQTCTSFILDPLLVLKLSKSMMGMALEISGYSISIL